MSLFTQFKHEAYRWATQPFRSYFLRQRVKTAQVPITVLYYHRVADTHPTSWTTSRTDFQRQIEWLQGNFELLSMDQVHQRLQEGKNPRPAVAITFDDGYAENMDFALPLLVERKIPCMYYVSTSPILNQTLFAHDHELSLNLKPNSVTDLKQIVSWGLDIGAHTRRHVDVAKITDLRQLRDEIEGCRRELIQLLNVPVEHFAFPFGQRKNISAAAMAVAKSAGYRTVCGAYGGYNRMGGDPFFIQRFHGDPCLARVKNWTTFDPRALSVEPQTEWLETSPLDDLAAELEAQLGLSLDGQRRETVPLPSALYSENLAVPWQASATEFPATTTVSSR